ncbi:MAG: universal stress protein [bacterium]|nr:universal stress protein [Gammaproteobacteria bacterium]HIL98065.1 universal stress protein [Pseudomonadales bacterium]
MAKYRKVLLALDFFGDNNHVVEKGREVASENDADLYLIHVIEPLSVAYAIDGLGVNEQLIAIESGIMHESKNKMIELSKELGVPDERTLICHGNPAHEIHGFAKEHDIDLIVLGTHGQKGLQLLLGSTANSVLHGVSCDVLAVRIK